MRKQGLWGDLLRGLRSPWLYVCLVAALVVWGLAWQTPSSYTLDVGGRQDDAFVSHFYDKEPSPNSQPHPDFTYRWTRADSSLDWPGLGLGNLPVSVTLRLAPAPGIASPVVTATVRGQAFPIALAPGLHDYSFQVATSGFFETDFEIRLHTRTVSPPGDGRDLGVLVDTATLAPAGPAPPQPTVVLPVAELLRWAVSLTLLWQLAHWLSGSARVATILSALAVLVVAWGILAERPNLGLLAPEVPWLLLSAYPVALIGCVAATYLSPYRERSREVRWTAAAFAAAYLLRVGGMVYPQFRTSDIGLHIHNIEKVLRGVLLWQGTLPNGAPSPYPPLPYIVLAPFSALLPDLSLLLRVGVGLLDASCVLPLFYLGSRLAGTRAGTWAAWVYALLVAPFALFSTGVFSNLFGQAVFTWTLAAWGAALLAPRVSPRLWAALTTGFFLTFLSHYGMLIAAVAVAGLFVLFALVAGPADIRKRALGVAGALAVAGIAAFLVYYITVVDLLFAPTGGVSSSGGRGSFDLLGLPDLLRRRLDPDLGALALLLALAGWLTAGRHARGVILLTAAAAVAAFGFAGVSMVVGDNIRYALLLAPFVALGAGQLLARIAGRGRPGTGWAVVILAILFWQLLGAWLPLIFTRYH